jgi:hypothetical protein
MVQAYNFLASWQLFPEKGIYEYGERPKSGIYKVEAVNGVKKLVISSNHVTLENKALAAQYEVMADGDLQPFDQPVLADQVQVLFPDSISFEIHFYAKGEIALHVVHEIQPNGYLKIVQQGRKSDGTAYTNTEIYHKQLSVLPYSASVAGAVIKANEEGIIKHKALRANQHAARPDTEADRIAGITGAGNTKKKRIVDADLRSETGIQTEYRAGILFV